MSQADAGVTVLIRVSLFFSLHLCCHEPGPVAVSGDIVPKCKPWAVSNRQDLSCIADESFCILQNLKTYGIIQVKEKNRNGNYKYP